MGEARLGGKKARVPVWFGRRLWHRTVQQKVVEAARKRPHLRLRVILTSSNSHRTADVEVPGAIIVPLWDVIARPDSIAVDAAILGARLRGQPTTGGSEPIALSPDGTQLRINGGDAITFGSPAQIEAIHELVKSYKAGGAGVRARDVTDFGSFSRLFGQKKWALLSPYLTSVNGLWTFRP